MPPPPLFAAAVAAVLLCCALVADATTITTYASLAQSGTYVTTLVGTLNTSAAPPSTSCTLLAGATCNRIATPTSVAVSPDGSLAYFLDASVSTVYSFPPNGTCASS